MKETESFDNNENEEQLLNDPSKTENEEPKEEQEEDKKQVLEQKKDQEKVKEHEQELKNEPKPEYTILSKEKERKSIIICLVISLVIIILGAILSFRARYLNKNIINNKSSKGDQLLNVILLNYSTSILKEYKLFDSSSINNILDSIDSIKIDGKKEKILNKFNFSNEGEHTLEIKFNKNITSLKKFFKDCDSLTNVDFSYFNSENISSLEELFSGCSSLVSVNFTNFTTSKVYSMRNMFSGCTNLQSINFEKFDSSKVKDMSGMFYNCKKIQNLNLSNFNTLELNEMNSMFYNCESLVSVDLQNFNTQNVKNMSALFYNCKSLTYIDISNLYYDNSKGYNNMFINIGKEGKIIYRSNKILLPNEEFHLWEKKDLAYIE
jgi:surface protein